MVVEIIETGVGFKAAGRLFQQIATGLGLAISNKERSEKTQELLEGLEVEFDTYEDVGKLIAYVMKEIPATEPKQAMGQIRKYCKLNDIDIPKKAKAPGGIKAKVFTFMIENPDTDMETFTEFMESLDRNEGTTRRYWEMFDVAKQMAKNIEA